MSSIDAIGARLRSIVRWWQPRRLSLGGLQVGPRRMARVALLAITGLCVLIVLHGLGVAVPLGSDHVPEFMPIPRVGELLVLLAMAVAAVSLTLASRREGPLMSRLLLLPFAALGIAVGGEMRDIGRLVGDPALMSTGGLAVAVLAAAPLLLPRRLWARWPAVFPALTLAPYAAVLLIYLLAGSDAYRLSPEFIANGHTSWNDVIMLREAVVKAAFNGALLPGVLAVNLLLIWQVVETVRATRDAASGGLQLRDRAATLLLILLIGKTGFLVFAFAGGLESAAHSRDDGLASWALAFALVAWGTWVMLQTPPPLEDRHVARAATVAVGGVAVGWTAVGVLLTFRGVSRLHGEFAENHLYDAIVVADRTALWIVALWPFALTVLGVVLLWRAQIAAGAAVLAFAVWGLPRAVSITGDVIAYAGTGLPVGRPVDYIEGNEQYRGWIDAVTLDAVVTGAVICLFVAWRIGRRPVAPPNILLFVLVLSTAVAHAGALIPGNWRTGAWFFVGLAFPVAYGFLLGARPLNRQTSHRELKVVSALAVTAFVLALTTMKVFNGDIRPGAELNADVGKVFLQVPLVALLAIVGVLGAEREASP